jgi:tripartite-type tricarboxylate transporter receptor subunit TctC
VWMAMFAPAGTPGPIVEKLNSDINKILKEPAILSDFQRIYMQPGGGTPEELAKLLRDDTERLGRIVKAAGVRID